MDRPLSGVCPERHGCDPGAGPCIAASVPGRKTISRHLFALQIALRLYNGEGASSRPRLPAMCRRDHPSLPRIVGSRIHRKTGHRNTCGKVRFPAELRIGNRQVKHDRAHFPAFENSDVIGNRRHPAMGAGIRARREAHDRSAHGLDQFPGYPGSGPDQVRHEASRPRLRPRPWHRGCGARAEAPQTDHPTSSRSPASRPSDRGATARTSRPTGAGPGPTRFRVGSA